MLQRSRLVEAVLSGAEPNTLRYLAQAKNLDKESKLFTHVHGKNVKTAFVLALCNRKYQAALELVSTSAETGVSKKLAAAVAAYFNDVHFLELMEATNTADFSPTGHFARIQNYAAAFQVAALRSASDVLHWLLARGAACPHTQRLVQDNAFILPCLDLLDGTFPTRPSRLIEPDTPQCSATHDAAAAAAALTGRPELLRTVYAALFNPTEPLDRMPRYPPYVVAAAALSGNAPFFAHLLRARYASAPSRTDDADADAAGSRSSIVGFEIPAHDADVSYFARILAGLASRPALTAPPSSPYAAAARGRVAAARMLLERLPRPAALALLTHPGSPVWEAARCGNAPLMALFLRTLRPQPTDGPAEASAVAAAAAVGPAAAVGGALDNGSAGAGSVGASASEVPIWRARAHCASIALVRFVGVSSYYAPQGAAVWAAQRRAVDMLIAAAVPGASFATLRTDTSARAAVRAILAPEFARLQSSSKVAALLPAALELLLELFLPRRQGERCATPALASGASAGAVPVPVPVQASWAHVLDPSALAAGRWWELEWAAWQAAARSPPPPELVEAETETKTDAGTAPEVASVPQQAEYLHGTVADVETGFSGADAALLQRPRDWDAERAACAATHGDRASLAGVGVNPEAAALCDQIAASLAQPLSTHLVALGLPWGPGPTLAAFFAPAPLAGLPLPASVARLVSAGARADDGTCALCRSSDASLCAPAAGGCAALRCPDDLACAEHYRRVCAAAVELATPWPGSSRALTTEARRTALRTLLGPISVEDKAADQLRKCLSWPSALAVLVDALASLLPPQGLARALAGLVADGSLAKAPDSIGSDTLWSALHLARATVSMRVVCAALEAATASATVDAAATTATAPESISLGDSAPGWAHAAPVALVLNAVLSSNAPMLRCVAETWDLTACDKGRRPLVSQIGAAAKFTPDSVAPADSARRCAEVVAVLEGAAAAAGRPLVWAEATLDDALVGYCAGLGDAAASVAAMAVLLRRGACWQVSADALESLSDARQAESLVTFGATVLHAVVATSAINGDAPVAPALRSVLEAVSNATAPPLAEGETH